MDFLTKKEQEELKSLQKFYKEIIEKEFKGIEKEFKGEFKEESKTPKNLKESLIANFRKLVITVNYKSEAAKYVVEFHLKKIKEICGIQEANHLVQGLDLEKLYKIKPFKK